MSSNRVLVCHGCDMGTVTSAGNYHGVASSLGDLGVQVIPQLLVVETGARGK